jgi:hypothetical protein
MSVLGLRQVGRQRNGRSKRAVLRQLPRYTETRVGGLDRPAFELTGRCPPQSSGRWLGPMTWWVVRAEDASRRWCLPSAVMHVLKSDCGCSHVIPRVQLWMEDAGGEGPCPCHPHMSHMQTRELHHKPILLPVPAYFIRQYTAVPPCQPSSRDAAHFADRSFHPVTLH